MEKLTHLYVTDTQIILNEGCLNVAVVRYLPATSDATVDRLAGWFDLHPGDLDGTLAERFDRLIDAMTNVSGVRQYQIQGATVDVPPQIEQIRMYPHGEEICVDIGQESETHLFATLTEAQRRLISSIVSSLTARCWEHLHQRLEVPPPRVKPQIFISYRRGHEKFAESLANRIGQEGIVPWFDKWDVIAGDSLPGKIEKAFATSIAFIPILTSDYQEGSWATEELRTAITKRIEEGFRIVPILLEPCERPELLRQLVYVDMTDHDPETFEGKIAEIVDGIFALEANPFRK